MQISKLFTFLIAAAFIIGCTSDPHDEIIKVVAKDFRFEVADTIPSGWSTFEFDNQGHAEHFFLLQKLPDSISYNTYLKEVTRQFDKVFDSIKAGYSKAEAVDLLINSVPSWFFSSVKQMGGAGIIRGGGKSNVTVKLTPGIYAMECYIKEQGIFHTALGMIKEITVAEEISSNSPPESNAEFNLTNFDIDMSGQIVSGKNVIAVNFKEHPETGMGNDIHIARLLPNDSIDSIISWIDWMKVKGLESPAPAEFLGGIQEMPVGYTGYFTVKLIPGKYIVLSEATATRGMVKTFNIE